MFKNGFQIGHKHTSVRQWHTLLLMYFRSILKKFSSANNSHQRALFKNSPPQQIDNLTLITPPYHTSWLNRSVPLRWVCGRWCDLAPTQLFGPRVLIRAQCGKSDSGALAFQKRSGENEPWRKSEAIIFIISRGCNCGNRDLWGEWEMHKLFLQSCWLAHACSCSN